MTHMHTDNTPAQSQSMPFSEAWAYAQTHADDSARYQDYTNTTLEDMEESERAIESLMKYWLADNATPFDITIVRNLADRNRAMSDALTARNRPPELPMRIPQHLPYRTVLKGLAALQARPLKEIEWAVNRKPQSEYQQRMRHEYYACRWGDTVTGIDLETTGPDPLRGRIINVGWLFIDLENGAQPYDGHSVLCGLPDLYNEHEIPFTQIHHITWADIAEKTEFRADTAFQNNLLDVLAARPYMAHFAAFEHTWFLYHLNGYAEAFKQGRILPVDTREICRKLDTDVDNMPSDEHPATLENWARRRGTLSDDSKEKHRGLDDADLMLRTVVAELERHDLLV